MTWGPAKPGMGGCVIDHYSSLRKLMRAAKRGTLPEQRLDTRPQANIATIEEAMRRAAQRANLYLNASARKKPD